MTKREFTEEHRQKLAEARKRYLEKIRKQKAKWAAFCAQMAELGSMPKSEETRQRMSEAKRGDKQKGASIKAVQTRSRKESEREDALLHALKDAGISIQQLRKATGEENLGALTRLLKKSKRSKKTAKY